MRDAGKIVLTPRGVYNPSAVYEPLDYISYQSCGWICKKTCTGVTPTDGEYYMCSADYSYISNLLTKVTEASEICDIKLGTAVTSPTSPSTGYYTNQLYINTSTSDLWKLLESGTWQLQGNMKGKDGKDGKAGTSVASIREKSHVGLVHTYEVVLTDGTVGGTFTVNDGQSGSGTGDMLKSVYDTNGNGKVDNAEKVGNADTSILEKFSVVNGKLLYDGKEISGGHELVTTKAQLEAITSTSNKVVEAYLVKQLSKSSGGGGAYIRVTTNEADFHGLNVTFTNGDYTVTEKFDSDGYCEANVTELGTYTISVTSGSDTYTTSVTVTCFSIYTATVNKFSASVKVNVNGGVSTSGATVVAKVKHTDGTIYSANAVNGIATVNVGKKGSYTVYANIGDAVSSSGSASITAEGQAPEVTVKFAKLNVSITCDTSTENITLTDGKSSYSYVGTTTDSKYVSLGTWVLSGKIDGENVSDTTNVTEYKEYSTSVSGGNAFSKWVKTQFPNKSASDCDALEEHEIAQLMSTKASVDMLVNMFTADANDFTKYKFGTNEYAMRWIGKVDYTAHALLKVVGDKIAQSEHWALVLTDSVPTMTANDAPEGEVSASSELSTTYQAYKAFNGTTTDADDCWHSKSTTSGYIRYKFDNPICIKKIVMQNRNSTDATKLSAPKDFTIRVSNDASTWTELGSFSNSNNTSNAKTNYDVASNSGYFTYAEMTISTSNGSALNIGDLNFYGRSLAGVPEIQATIEELTIPKLKQYSGISTTYTSLDDLLNPSDETKEQAEKDIRQIMTVHKSAKLMVQHLYASEDFREDFTSSRIGMKWLGLRDYACDLAMGLYDVTDDLLASTHWEYILKDSVPKMTDYKVPEGEASANSENKVSGAYRLAWYPFSGDESGTNLPWHGSAKTLSGNWLQYKFANPITVKKLRLMTSMIGSGDERPRIKSFEIRASNDGFVNDNNLIFTVDEMGTQEKVGNVWLNGYDIPNSNTPYLYWRFVITGGYVETNQNLNMLNFYGRALNESVPVMTDNTLPIGECFASSEQTSNPAWYAFINKAYYDTGGGFAWKSNNTNYPCHIGYDFKKPIVAKSFVVQSGTGGGKELLKNFEIIARNSSSEEWTTLGSYTAQGVAFGIERYSINNDVAYKQYALNLKDSNVSTNAEICWLNFYGVSYSEEEFGTDGIEMLYDNGVKLVSGEWQKTSTTHSTITFDVADDYVLVNDPSATSGVNGRVGLVYENNNLKTQVAEVYDREGTLAGGYLENWNNPSGTNEAESVTNILTNKGIDKNADITRAICVQDVSNFSGTRFACFVTSSANVGTFKIAKLYFLK